jgi:hypothetical protein
MGVSKGFVAAGRHSGKNCRGTPVPKGWPNGSLGHAHSAVPSGLGTPNTAYPTLKRWATIDCPYGTAVLPILAVAREHSRKQPLQLRIHGQSSANPQSSPSCAVTEMCLQRPPLPSPLLQRRRGRSGSSLNIEIPQIRFSITAPWRSDCRYTKLNVRSSPVFVNIGG